MLNANLPPRRGNISFNAQHAPMGAHWNFTCGHFGSRGGFSLPSMQSPGNQDLFIGVKRGRDAAQPLTCLPFFDRDAHRDVNLYSADQIQRRYGWATDRWTTEDFDFTIFSPFGGIVDPRETHPSMSRVCLVPAILASLTIDNSTGAELMSGIFAIKFNQPGLRLMDEQHGWRGKTRAGFALGRELGFQATLDTEPNDRDAKIQPLLRHDVLDAFRDTPAIHHLGDCGGVRFDVPAGTRRTLLIALGAYQDGIITSRMEGRFYYTRHFASLIDVLDHTLRGHDAIRAGSAELDRELFDSKLSDEQQFLIAHSTRSYYAGTKLLEVAGQPFWIVNDSEHGLMNPLDAAADQVFWELKQNPWVVRNLLDNYLRHYSYQDQIKVPRTNSDDLSEQAGHDLVAGGLSFCRDMGAHDNFAPPGHSSYEMPDRSGAFSYMTQEQLCNWILIAASYVARSGDLCWVQQQRDVIYSCMRSMLNREGIGEMAATVHAMAGTGGPPAHESYGTSSGVSSHAHEESGIMRFDSARCGSGRETTTYGALDASFADARNSIYLAVKRVATYLGLEFLFSRLNDLAAEDAAAHAAHQAADAIARRMCASDGCLPASFDANSPEHRTRALPAVEALLFPWYWGTCEYGSEYKSSRAWLGNGNESFVAKLKRHAITLLTDPQRRNTFDDGGLKLSSSGNNTWLSKVAIFQYIAREVFHVPDDPRAADALTKADAAHARWQVEAGESAGCSDRFDRGRATGGSSSARAITTALWMDRPSS